MDRTKSVVTPQRFATGMTFDQYVAYVATPENLKREGSGGAARRDWSAHLRVSYEALRLDVNHAVRTLLGASKVSFASAEETKAITGMMIGGVTVFALPPDLPIYVDDKLMQREWVILGSGSRSSKIKIAPEVFRRLPNATIVPDLALEIAR